MKCSRSIVSRRIHPEAILHAPLRLPNSSVIRRCSNNYIVICPEFCFVAAFQTSPQWMLLDPPIPRNTPFLHRRRRPRLRFPPTGALFLTVRRLFSFFKACIFNSFLPITCLPSCCSVVGVQGVPLPFVAPLEARVRPPPAHPPIVLSFFNPPPPPRTAFESPFRRYGGIGSMAHPISVGRTRGDVSDPQHRRSSSSCPHSLSLAGIIQTI